LTLISLRLYRRHSVNNDKANVANNTAITALFFSAAGLVSAQSDAPYTEGPVWAITMVRTKAGMTDDYLKNLAKNYRASMDEEKKQDIIMDYKILLGDASTAQDYDILLMVEYKNMAALDSLREKMDPIGRKIIGGEEQQRQGAVKRALLATRRCAKSSRFHKNHRTTDGSLTSKAPPQWEVLRWSHQSLRL
jgi:hypothetical protein